jgi:hypothetical protein
VGTAGYGDCPGNVVRQGQSWLAKSVDALSLRSHPQLNHCLLLQRHLPCSFSSILLTRSGSGMAYSGLPTGPSEVRLSGLMWSCQGRRLVMFPQASPRQHMLVRPPLLWPQGSFVFSPWAVGSSCCPLPYFPKFLLSACSPTSGGKSRVASQVSPPQGGQLP